MVDVEEGLAEQDGQLVLAENHCPGSVPLALALPRTAHPIRERRAAAKMPEAQIGRLAPLRLAPHLVKAPARSARDIAGAQAAVQQVERRKDLLGTKDEAEVVDHLTA
eukprot:TRINITY_DN14922_c0_g1_i1.p2 TRINITY_DN14922_c0_g1~~TRINITY_DN14922_c0_g1_i1.p2  ORF type:complete len:122 (+),score=3.24 TRINITY_DN14922_c0_g1_i1:43-366(+)